MWFEEQNCNLSKKPDEQLATITTRDEQVVPHSQAVHHVASLFGGTYQVCVRVITIHFLRWPK